MPIKKAEIEANIRQYNDGKEPESHIQQFIILEELDEMIIYVLIRNNGQQLLCFAFKLSKNYDAWFWVLPTENMLRRLIKAAPKLIELLNQNNKKDPQRDDMGLHWFMENGRAGKR